MENLRYPIGHFQMPDNFSKENINYWIKDIQDAPAQYRALVAGWTDEQLDTPYRPEGWTVRQLIHHVACLLYTSPSPRDATLSRMPSSA